MVNILPTTESSALAETLSKVVFATQVYMPLSFSVMFLIVSRSFSKVYL